MPPAASRPGGPRAPGQLLLEVGPSRRVVARRSAGGPPAPARDRRGTPRSTCCRRTKLASRIAGAGEQRQGERDLRRGQRAAQPRQPAATGRGSRLLAQRLRPAPRRRGAAPAACRRPRRSRPVATSANSRTVGSRPTSSSRGKRVAAEALQDADAGGRRAPRPTRPPRPASTRFSIRSWRASRDAARAQRRAHRELVHAAGRPHQHEVGDVHAGDEQDQRRRPRTRGAAGRARRDTSSSCSGTADDRVLLGGAAIAPASARPASRARPAPARG